MVKVSSPQEKKLFSRAVAIELKLGDILTNNQIQNVTGVLPRTLQRDMKELSLDSALSSLLNTASLPSPLLSPPPSPQRARIAVQPPSQGVVPLFLIEDKKDTLIKQPSNTIV